MNYSAYTAKDFAKDTFFQKWVLDPDSETAAFWQTWLSQYPGKIATIAEAKEIIAALEFQADLESNRAFIEIWDNISTAKEEEKETEAKWSGATGVSLWVRQHQQLAAVFMGLAVLCSSLFFCSGRRRHQLYVMRHTMGKRIPLFCLIAQLLL